MLLVPPTYQKHEIINKLGKKLKNVGCDQKENKNATKIAQTGSGVRRGEVEVGGICNVR